jgi:hypothetical protein
MRRRFHIVAVTPDLQEALAVQTSAGWLLPCLDDNPHHELPSQVEVLLERFADSAEMIHEAPLAQAPAIADATDACILATLGRVAIGSSRVRLRPIADLLSGRALLPLQYQALTASVARLTYPQAPFDSPRQVSAVRAWIDEQIASHTGSECLSITRHRCCRYEYVIACESVAGRMYFKGGRDRITDEAAITELLWRLDPQRFPQTVALDRANDRWLYRALPGELLIGARLTLDSAVDAVRTLASVQKRAMTLSVEAHFTDHAKHRHMNGVELLDQVDRMVERIDPPTTLRERWTTAVDHIRLICETLDALHLPQTLVLSDFWSRNILQTPAGFGFIDLEQSYWSYPFLSLWKFLREVEHHLHARGQARAQLQRAFVDEWQDVVPASTMTRAFEHLPLLERLFSLLVVSRELDLEERGLGGALPNHYRSQRLATHIERCLEEVVPVGSAILHRRREL